MFVVSLSNKAGSRVLIKSIPKLDVESVDLSLLKSSID